MGVSGRSSCGKKEEEANNKIRSEDSETDPRDERERREFWGEEEQEG
jgi:hypothetical protein